MSDEIDRDEEQNQVAVALAAPDFRISPAAVPYWEVAGMLIANTRANLGNEMAFSIMLSRTMRELRRVYGVKCAIETLQGFIDTTEDAAKYDL